MPRGGVLITASLPLVVAPQAADRGAVDGGTVDGGAAFDGGPATDRGAAADGVPASGDAAVSDGGSAEVAGDGCAVSGAPFELGATGWLALLCLGLALRRRR